MFFPRKKIRIYEINPDEVLLDARNLPKFDIDQFEGRIERPIGKRALFLFSVALALVFFVFVGQLFKLQVVQGEEYRERAENNSLRHTPIFSERGIIYDRRGMELAWNETGAEDQEFPDRIYKKIPGLAHVLGYVNYPKKDTSGSYYQTEFIGKDGTEKQYQNILAGVTGTKILEVDVRGNLTSESAILPPKNGTNITLSIDAELQSAFYGYIRDLAGEVGFSGGAGVIIDVENGEILALTSFPEYDPNMLSSGKDTQAIAHAITNTRVPFLNRAIGGLYTPGSTIKPFFGIAALTEHIISPEKEILSTGSIAISNPYNPELKTVFNDWKAHGWVDLRRAIAVSSNVYFFEIGGGYKDQPGLGIEKLETYARMFGMGEKTGIDLPGEAEGIIPNPVWKEENFPGDPWRIGDTYNTAIGQYGFQITPIQLARGLSAIANGGTIVDPHMLLGSGDATGGKIGAREGIPISEADVRVIREGMRMTVTEGIGQALNVPFVNVAAKSGTAEVGAAKRYANSWISGFFPYDQPRYAFAVVMEKGPRNNTHGAVFVMRNLFDWMAENANEYLE